MAREKTVILGKTPARGKAGRATAVSVAMRRCEETGDERDEQRCGDERRAHRQRDGRAGRGARRRRASAFRSSALHVRLTPRSPRTAPRHLAETAPAIPPTAALAVRSRPEERDHE